MIFGGVVLLDRVVIPDSELVGLSDTEIGKKYGWIADAPNVQMRRDLWEHRTVIRSRVPVITDLVKPGG